MYQSNIGLPNVINPFLNKGALENYFGEKKNYNVRFTHCFYQYKMSGSLTINIKLDRDKTPGKSDI